jgi:hypothetical protein
MTVHEQSLAATRKLTPDAGEIFAKNKKCAHEATQLKENKRSQPRRKAIYNPPQTHLNPFITHFKPIYKPFFRPETQETGELGSGHTHRG